MLFWWSPATATARETDIVTSTVAVPPAVTVTGRRCEREAGLADDERVSRAGTFSIR